MVKTKRFSELAVFGGERIFWHLFCSPEHTRMYFINSRVSRLLDKFWVCGPVSISFFLRPAEKSMCEGSSSPHQQFELKWHYQEATFTRNLSAFLVSNILTDCTICVESHNLRAHKLILAMCSDYFFQLFQDMAEGQHPLIVLHNVALLDVKAVLAFIYRGKCIVSKEQIPSIISVAKLLKIQGLCDMNVPDQLGENRPKNEFSPNNPPQTPPEILNLEEDAVKRPKDLSETCKCFLCGKYLSNQYNLRVHMETHEEAYHACQSCPHVSRSRDALRKHVSYRHPKEYHIRKRKKIN